MKLVIEPPSGIESDEWLFAVIHEDATPEFLSYAADCPTNKFTNLIDLCAHNWPAMPMADMFEYQSRESMRIAAALRKLKTNKS